MARFTTSSDSSLASLWLLTITNFRRWSKSPFPANNPPNYCREGTTLIQLCKFQLTSGRAHAGRWLTAGCSPTLVVWVVVLLPKQRAPSSHTHTWIRLWQTREWQVGSSILQNPSNASRSQLCHQPNEKLQEPSEVPRGPNLKQVLIDDYNDSRPERCTTAFCWGSTAERTRLTETVDVHAADEGSPLALLLGQHTWR